MEFLRKLFLQTRSHLKGMTLSQRLAIGSCVALVAVALLWLMTWAGRAEMVPLLDQALTAQELAPIQQQLEALGAKYEVVGESILVPAEGRLRLQAQLAQRDALPKDISLTFNKLIENSSPWLSMDEQAWRRNVALGNELSRVLREFEGVRDARVFLDKSTKRMFGAPSVTPTASVFVKLAAGKPLDQDRVFALASFVSRAVAGLDVSNVQVTDFTTGISQNVRKSAEGMAFDDLDDRRKKEHYFADKIKELLAHVPGLQVAVHAELDPKSEQVTKQEHGKAVPTRERSEEMTQISGGPAAEPGVVSNVSPMAAVAAGAGNKMEKTVRETELDGKASTTLTTTETPRHGLKSLSASVNVPRSYLAAIYKEQNGGKEPTDEDLNGAASTKKTLTAIERQANRALGVAEGGTSIVAVDWFHDSATIVFSPTAEATAGQGAIEYVRQYGSKAGLGFLAVMSLVLMLMMVRRVGEGSILPGESPPPKIRVIRSGRSRADQQVEPMQVGTAPIGEAEVSEHLLVGKEVDAKTLRTQKVIEQVGELIKEDVEASVSILQRWINAETE